MPDNSDESWREKQRAWQRAYYERHKAALNAKARARHADRMADPGYQEQKRAQKKRYYWRHKAEENARNRAYRTAHPELKEKKRARKALDPERAKQQQLLYTTRRRERRYGEADRPKAKVCDICGDSKFRIVFDHCHKRGHFRGWLCDRCNRALGFVEDDITLMQKMMAYLRRTRRSASRQFTLPGI